MKLHKNSSNGSKKRKKDGKDQQQGATGNSRRKKRRAARHANRHLDAIPEEIMVLLASRFLSPVDVAAARCACKAWSKVLRKGISSVTLPVTADLLSPLDVRTAAKRTAKDLAKTSMSDLELLIGTRSQYETLRGLLAGAKPQWPQLKRLKLRFLLSKTPQHRWPIVVPLRKSELHRLRQVEELHIESSTYIHQDTLHPLLRRLRSLWAHTPTGNNSGSGSAQGIPRRLDFELGQRAGSQLPAYGAPAWLELRTPARITAFDDTLLVIIAELPSLAALRCPVSPVCNPGVLSRLTGLTELQLYGNPILLKKTAEGLQQLRSLRVLSFSLMASGKNSPVLDALPGLDFVQDLALTIEGDAAGGALETVLERPPAGLRGLTVSGLALQQSFITQLAGLTNLTSLQLVKAAVSDPMLDLTAWRQLSSLRKLTLEVTQPQDLMQLKFEPPPPPPKPARVLTGAASSIGKRRKSAAQQQLEQSLMQRANSMDRTRFGEVSAMLAAWPHLQALRLSGLPPYAVAHTSWRGLSTLTALTSLALQFGPPSAYHRNIAVPEGCKGLKYPPGSPGAAMPVLRLEYLPAGVQSLQLTNCYIGVPAAGMLRAGESLRTVSLARCYMGSIEKGITSRWGYPVIVQDSPPEPNGSPAAAPAAADGAVGTPLPPLLQFLQHTPQLHMLELIHLPWLTDEVLSAAAQKTQLRGLSSLSVVGIGNQQLTHGALLGLTGLSKLRELRWHVGSPFDLLPDVQALAQLQGLMTVHFPHWLCAQFERWGGYAVLEELPMCDVNAEMA